MKYSKENIGDEIPGRDYTPDIAQSMLYNASLWNAHRIHFDYEYATREEGYEGLILPGPLIGDWLHQCIQEWLDDSGRIHSMSYSNRLASIVGETLTSGGVISGIDDSGNTLEIEVFVKNSKGEIVAPGKAVVKF